MKKAVGIDFGTTNTIVCYKNRKNEIVSYRAKDHRQIIPSVLFFRNENDWIIGEEARQNYQLNPAAGVINFKSRLGRDIKYKIMPDEDADHEFWITPEQAAGMFLKRVLRDVQEQMEAKFQEGCEIETAVIAVPAKFNYKERQAVRQAVMDAAIPEKNIEIVTEPAAAAYAHMSSQNDLDSPKSVLVYDFGGGTLDVSVLIVSKDGIFREAVIGGDKRLGGNRLTEDIMSYISDCLYEEYGWELPVWQYDETFHPELGMNETEKLNWYRIFEEAERMKKLASNHWDCGNKNFSVSLRINGEEKICRLMADKHKVEKLLEKDIERTAEIAGWAADVAHGQGIETIDRVVLAGGSSQIQLIREKLKEKLGMNISVAGSIHTLVAEGAALFAEETDKTGWQTVSKTSTQIGIETKLGNILDAFKPVIDVNEQLPCSQKITVMLNEDDAQHILIGLYERDILNEEEDEQKKIKRINDSSIVWLDDFLICGLPDGLKKEGTEIDLTLSVQKDGLLKAEALVRKKDGEVVDSSVMKMHYGSNFK